MSVLVESLDQDGRGIARDNGKAIFIEGALPGERVDYLAIRKKPNYDIARVSAIFRTSALRVRPACPYFGTCGGCNMQHLDFQAQVAAKQRILEETLARIGKVTPALMLPPIYGPAWGYRHRARLSVRHVTKKGGVLAGFHEKHSSYIADMDSCAVLPPQVSSLLPALKRTLTALSIADRLPQVEVAVGEAVTVLVLRVLAPLSTDDERLLRDFAEQHAVQLWLQAGGPQSAQPFWPQGAPPLDYALPDFGVRIGFSPTEFTQVNPAVNRVLVRRVVQRLAPQPGERVLDLFCGLGNFTLPIASRGANVLGIEGSPPLIERAKLNAARNSLNAQFVCADLYGESVGDTLRGYGGFDKVLIDPPRDGALEVAKSLSPEWAPRTLVYVSCNAGTLARDAAILVHTKGYRLEEAGVVNMFPHTGHVESVAVFRR